MTPKRTAPRWGAVAIVFAIVALIAVLPERYRILPNWVSYLEVAILIVPMALVSLTHGKAFWQRAERLAEFVVIGGALFLNAANVVIVAYNVVENPGTLQPIPLFYTSVGIWTGNILIFALIYWLVDSGGPDRRLDGKVLYPDFNFPAMEEDAPVAPNWRPEIVDYLFLAFTTTTAFSPTEAMPLTSRAKFLVMIQSGISLITIAV
ncbi:MAG TPA: hypothetical protein VHT92_01270, partial [Candidatus Cybelea sp.]|nr:hypothetical protein [Candidatus Cybelea sp.]